MKKIILLMILAAISAAGALAQHREPSKKMIEEVREFKLKFLAQEMELKEDQQQRFAELYSQMMDEKHKVFCAARKLEKQVKANDAATDEDYEAVSTALTEAKAKDADIERRYDEKFSAFLSKKQIFKMKQAEDKFRQKMREMHGKKKRRK